MNPRFVAALEVQLQGRATLTTNISANGLYFLREQPLVVGQRLPLVLPFVHATPGGVRVACTGRVVRIEPRGRQYGIAVVYEPDSFERV